MERQGEPLISSGVSRLLFILLTAVGVGRIISTYGVFCQTFDEPASLACGIEWLDKGTYSIQALHPPLARVAVSLGPYLDGVRSTGETFLWREGTAVLYSRNTYMRNLTLARLGVLPFFVIACWVVWSWTRVYYGETAAVASVFLFSSLPPILAHSGNATTDMAAATFCFGAVYALVGWLERPTAARSMWLGAAMALAVLSKFSAMVFLPVCILVVLVLRCVAHHRSWLAGLRELASRRKLIALASVVAALTIWAGYRFSLNPLIEPGPQASVRVARIPVMNRLIGGNGTLAQVAETILTTPIPARELIQGLYEASRHPSPASYLLGEYSEEGRWNYFPVVLAVKTPLAFLILVALGILRLAQGSGTHWCRWSPVLCAAFVLLAMLPGKINLGVRHILVIYPFLAIVSGLACAWLLELMRTRRAAGVALLGLLGWHSASVAWAHPDYLSYFNGLAGSEPAAVVTGSDLDWGQDLLRLSQKLKELKVQHLTLGYFGTAIPERHGLPAFTELAPYEPVTGWVAISEHRLRVGGQYLRRTMKKSTGAFDWLNEYQPVARVGKSIRLYYIKPGNTP